jgi:hypothetical protein
MLLAFALVALPSAYHRLAAGGEDTGGVHRVASRATGAALLPLAIALGLELSMAAARLKAIGALATALAATAVALGLWYVGRYLARGARAREHARESEMASTTPVDEKIRHVLTEARMVLPGAQALLGFQLAVTLMDAFQSVPARAQLLHLADILLTALAVVLLIAPAAYHRIALAGENTESFHRLASALVLAAMVPLGLALSGDMGVVAYEVMKDAALAALIGASALALFAVAWFAFPLGVRGARQRRAGARASPLSAGAARSPR